MMTDTKSKTLIPMIVLAILAWVAVYAVGLVIVWGV